MKWERSSCGGGAASAGFPLKELPASSPSAISLLSSHRHSSHTSHEGEEENDNSNTVSFISCQSKTGSKRSKHFPPPKAPPFSQGKLTRINYGGRESLDELLAAEFFSRDGEGREKAKKPLGHSQRGQPFQSQRQQGMKCLRQPSSSSPSSVSTPSPKICSPSPEIFVIHRLAPWQE